MSCKRMMGSKGSETDLPNPVGPSDEAETPDNFEVGYGKPPKETRFKPGQSGNPRGRPKGRLSAIEALSRELDQKVSVCEGNKTFKISKREAAIKRLVADGMAGKKHAIEVILAHERALADATGQAVAVSDDDVAILERFLARVAAPINGGEDDGV